MIVKILDYGDENNRKFIEYGVFGLTSNQMRFLSENLEEETSVVDGVACRVLIFLGKPDKHGTKEQQFYWDRELPLPAFNPGDEVTLKYTGRNIIGYQQS